MHILIYDDGMMMLTRPRGTARHDAAFQHRHGSLAHGGNPVHTETRRHAQAAKAR